MPSAQINQPSNQIRLTNVSLVRLKQGKKRFEVAAYKNTVQSYRAGNETDLDQVLQVRNVFLDVSRGRVAPNDELRKAFPNLTRDEVVLEILRRGDIQVGEKERAHELERLHREVVDLVAARLVDPTTRRVYTPGMIAKALEQLSSQGGQAGRAAAGKSGGGGGRDDASTAADAAPVPDKPVWKGVSTTRSAKSQALDAIRALVAHQPIAVARARMRLRITCPTNVARHTVAPPAHYASSQTASSSKSDAAAANTGDAASAPKKKLTVREALLSFVEAVERQDTTDEEWEVVGFVEPGAYRTLAEFAGERTAGRARVEVLDMAVTHDED